MNRRQLLSNLSVGAILTIPLPLVDCANQSNDTLVMDVNLLAAGLGAVVAALGAPGLPVTIPPGVLATAQAAVADIQANAPVIGNALSPNRTAIQEIVDAVSSISLVLTPFLPGVPVIAAVVQAALALVPTIISFIPVTPTPTPSPVPVPPAAKAARRSLTDEQAQAVLKAAPAMLKRGG